MSICNIVAILTSVDKSGWATLEHHLDIVDGFFPNWLRQPFTRLLFLYKNYFEAIYIFHISKTVKHNAKLFIFVENKNHSHFLFCALIYINAIVFACCRHQRLPDFGGLPLPQQGQGFRELPERYRVTRYTSCYSRAQIKIRQGQIRIDRSLLGRLTSAMHSVATDICLARYRRSVSPLASFFPIIMMNHFYHARGKSLPSAW